MRVVVLGGGVVGVTTAYFLARHGNEVTLVERRTGTALETSFANAGQVSPGYASPWAAPGVPLKAVKWLMMEHAPLILRPRWDGAMINWLCSMLRNCTSERYAVNKRRMGRLAEYSRAQLEALRASTHIQYDQRTNGTLQLFRTKAQLDSASKDVEVLTREGVTFELLTRQQCIAVEPGLAFAQDDFVGGLRLPNDETGDCYKFTQQLTELCRDHGVQFRFGETVRSIEHDRRTVTAVRTDLGILRAEAFVVALGSYSPALVRPLGIKLPVYPVKGYSITANVLSDARAPKSTVLDESYKVAITRLGDRVRVGGMAELSGFNDQLPVRRQRTLELSVSTLFPGACDLSQVSFWSGLRPMTPDGTPLVGRSKLRNLFLNTGHGTLGWTMACGSARVVTDLITGRAPEIESDDLSFLRYEEGAQAAFA